MRLLEGMSKANQLPFSMLQVQKSSSTGFPFLSTPPQTQSRLSEKQAQQSLRLPGQQFLVAVSSRASKVVKLMEQMWLVKVASLWPQSMTSGQLTKQLICTSGIGSARLIGTIFAYFFRTKTILSGFSRKRIHYSSPAHTSLSCCQSISCSIYTSISIFLVLLLSSISAPQSLITYFSLSRSSCVTQRTVVLWKCVKVRANLAFISIGQPEVSSSHSIEYFINYYAIVIVLFSDSNMRSFEDSAGLDIANVTRVNNCSNSQTEATKVGGLVQNGSEKDKASLRKADTQKLYVKEFFDHFFEKRSMLEVLSQISNGIQVIQTLVAHFEHSRGIRSEEKLAYKSKTAMNGLFSNVIEKEGRQVSECVEDLYHRLQNIFEHCAVSEEKEIEASPQHRRGNEAHADQELYDMLNDYKADNKKQKELRKKAEHEAAELRRQLNRVEDEKIRLSQLFKERQAEIIEVNKKLAEAHTKIEDLTQEIAMTATQRDQLSEKLTLLFEINENLSSTQKENLILEQRLRQASQRESHLTKKFQALQGIIQSRIKQRDDKWMSMIQSKLTSKTLFENASCSAFRQFMGNMQSLNKC